MKKMKKTQRIWETATCPAGRDICRWVIMDISKLEDKNEMAAYEYCKQIVVESSQSGERLNQTPKCRHLI